MVILHSYVKLPEGILCVPLNVRTTLNGLVLLGKSVLKHVETMVFTIKYGGFLQVFFIIQFWTSTIRNELLIILFGLEFKLRPWWDCVCVSPRPRMGHNLGPMQLQSLHPCWCYIKPNIALRYSKFGCLLTSLPQLAHQILHLKKRSLPTIFSPQAFPTGETYCKIHLSEY